MPKQKGNITALILVLLGVTAITVFSLMGKLPELIQHNPTLGGLYPKPGLQNQAQDTGDMSEDDLSMYKIPNDVLAAINESKETDRPVLGIRADGPTFHIPILMYHYVEHVKDAGDKIRISLNTVPEILDRQIKTMVDAGYNFITPSDLADILDGIKQLPQKPVMLTFDDGYRDFYTDAFPILKKYNIRAVNYVVSGFLNKPNNLTENQLKEIAKSGLVEIGAHTVNHLALKRISAPRLTKEVGLSRVQLEEEIGQPVTAFAYPYGSYDINAVQAVKQAGYRTAVSTVPGSSVNNSVRYLAFRLRPGAATGQNLINLLEKN